MSASNVPSPGRAVSAGPRPSRRLCALAFGLGTLGLACGSADKVVEDVPPAEITVTVTSPTPGAEMLAAEHPSILVSGNVTTTDPTQGALEAWVNGVRVDVIAGAFRTELTPEVGINHIKVEGGNGLVKLVGKELDVLWAPAYMTPLEGQTGFDVAGALELRLGQRFFDAQLPGSVLDLSTDPVVARDVASAVELILHHIELADLLPGSIELPADDPLLSIAISSVTPASIITDVRIVDGAQRALDLKIDLLGVFLAMDGSFTFGDRALVIDGGITADLHAAARLTIGTAADGSIDVAVTNVTATVGPLAPAFTGADGEDLNAFITLGGAGFRALIEGLLADLIPTFTDRLPPLLETVLGAADDLLDNIQFTLDTGLGTPVMLQLDGNIGALDVRAGPTGHVTVRQDLAIRTSGSPIHAASRGAARLDASTADPVFGPSGLHLVLRQDLLNALLHSLWNAGMLEGPLTSGGLSATISAKLPPVIRPTPASSPCKIDGERCDVLLQLGQVEVHLVGFDQTFAINASAGARIEVNGGSVSLKIQSTPELRVWETTPVPGTLKPDGIRDLIIRVVWPNLFGAIGNNLMIALPLPDLAALGIADLAPGLADAQLLLQMRQRPSVMAGRFILGADLAFTTPRP